MLVHGVQGKPHLLTQTLRVCEVARAGDREGRVGAFPWKLPRSQEAARELSRQAGITIRPKRLLRESLRSLHLLSTNALHEIHPQLLPILSKGGLLAIFQSSAGKVLQNLGLFGCSRLCSMPTIMTTTTQPPHYTHWTLHKIIPRNNLTCRWQALG